MPSNIKQNCSTCKYGILHEGTPFKKCGRSWYRYTCITVSGREHWEPSYEAMSHSLDEFERCQGIVNDFIKAEEMTI